MSNRFVYAAVFGVVTLSLIPGCADDARQQYVTECQSANVGNVDQCACVYDLSKESLTEEQHNLFLAMSVDNNQEASAIRSKMGVIGTTTALARVAWLAANAEEACGFSPSSFQ